MLGAPEYLDSAAVLDAIEVQQGILVERATDYYSFSHLTLQEYLTALYIVDKRLEDELVERYLKDERWREIFLLVAGLSGNTVIPFLSRMEEESRTYINGYSKLESLVGWAAVNKVGESELSQRAMMLAIAIESAKTIDSASAKASAIASASARASARARAIESAIESAIAIASARARAIAIDIAIDIDIARARARAIDRASAIARASARAIASASTHHFLQDETFNSIAAGLSTYQQEMPDVEKGTSEQWNKFSNNLLLFWLKTLELSKNDIRFFSNEVQSLSDYLYANELILRCKESAVYLYREQWASLEKRMLTSDCESAEG